MMVLGLVNPGNVAIAPFTKMQACTVTEHHPVVTPTTDRVVSYLATGSCCSGKPSVHPARGPETPVQVRTCRYTCD